MKYSRFEESACMEGGNRIRDQGIRIHKSRLIFADLATPEINWNVLHFQYLIISRKDLSAAAPKI